MTDYLELLLEQTQDEWEEQPLDWKKAVRVPPMDREDRQEQEGQRSSGKATDVDQAQRRYGAEAEIPEALAKREADVLEQLDRLGRAALRGRSEGAASRTSRQDSGINSAVSLRLGTVSDGAMPGSAVRLASVLDAAFERDARRYDGPLGLL